MAFDLTNPTLDTIAQVAASDPGLQARIPQSDIDGGVAAARAMNAVIAEAMLATGVNQDGILSPADLATLSAHIRADPDLYDRFVIAHGDDEGNEETGFHLVQGDGSTLQFQGRNFVNTIADAIYHVGFAIVNGRFRNEDGDENERVDDVAGWLNYFVNGVNVVYGSDAAETLHSGTYSTALAAAEAEYFDAGAGNDKIWAGRGADTVDAGDGNDTSSGQEGNDLMLGRAGHDTLWGEKGEDTLQGGEGNDVMGGGTGADTVKGGTGNDQVGGNEGDDRLAGQDGNDTVAGHEGHDRMSGGTGHDTLWAGSGNDTAHGGAGDDHVGGDLGHDSLTGGRGADTVVGQEGDDSLAGNNGADQIWAGEGQDTAAGGAGNDLVGGQEGADSLSGGLGADTLWGGIGADTLSGGKQADQLGGQEGNDLVQGNQGHDQLNGGDGQDTLEGGAGNDTLTGAEGRDHFIGGRGVDILQDWEDIAARDVFVFAPGDTGIASDKIDIIRGFSVGLDKIDLSAFGGLGFTAGSFAGTGAGEVRFQNNLVLIDANGDGRAEAAIRVDWVNEMSVSDFVL